MGLRDKLTGLREQAQEAVAEHKDQIQGAMESAGEAVDRQDAWQVHGQDCQVRAKGKRCGRELQRAGLRIGRGRASGAAGNRDSLAG